MPEIYISRIKPNPAGKDRTRHGGATIAQLGAEWVDIYNNTSRPISLVGIALYHKVFRPGQQPEWDKVVDLVGTLPAGQTLRIHSGQKRSLDLLHTADVQGAALHSFTGRDAYVWNNAEGDSPALWRASNKSWVDQTSYDPNPAEGAILTRSGTKLVGSTRSASGW